MGSACQLADKVRDYLSHALHGCLACTAWSASAKFICIKHLAVVTQISAQRNSQMLGLPLQQLLLKLKLAYP